MSVNLNAQVEAGSVATKGTRLRLENASDWVFSLKWMQFSLYLTDSNHSFFQQYLHFEWVKIFMVFILFVILCCYGNQSNLTRSVPPTRLRLENASDWVFSLKWMQFSLYLTDFNHPFFNNICILSEFKFSWYLSYLWYFVAMETNQTWHFHEIYSYGGHIFLIIRERKTRDTPKWYTLEALLNGRLKLVVMVALLPW